MSLSVPYVLAAAAEVAASEPMECGNRAMTVAGLDRASAGAARALLSAGYGPGSRHRVSCDDVDALVEQLASARIGVILSQTDEPGAAVEASLEVLEQRVWSETPLVETADGSLLTHGDLLTEVASDSPRGAWPEGLKVLVSDLVAIGEQT